MPSPLTETATFTESSQALTAIVDQFRNQTLPLEEALALFEKGIGYVRSCQSTLGNAKGKLQTLSQALAEVQTTAMPTTTEDFTPTVPTEVVAVENPIQNCYVWQHQQVLTNTSLVMDEAWLKQVLLALKASLPFQTQGLPKIYERENQSGLEAFLPLANGWLMASVWKPKAPNQGTIQLQLQLAEDASTVAETLDASVLLTALTKAIA
ncbi:MAG: exodeoxyribonuclease VII small subunit [Vampirovibrio sp.]|nr:exodeoxyribonuclease VII small subunit [Vampirovibrio sp.]